ncbi:MAG: LptF/LptG family permease [Acidobacteria bacterium]|nr:LptF/LptG family permease [Acidobacteriota bacterium]
MLRTIDRYILKETLPMVFLSLLVLTFMLMIPPLMGQAQDLLAKGVDFATVATLMGLLIPQGLGVTIPMAVLMGLLMGLGRLSGDRETVAMQACGISLARMLLPVSVLAVGATAATCYVMLVALPDSNQAFREIVFQQLASYTADQVKPQVWDRSLPGVNLYVRNVNEQGTKWTDVFLAMNQDQGQPVVYVAKEGRIVVDYDAKTVDIELLDGSIHRVPPDDPEAYTETKFTQTLVPFDAESVFIDGTGPPPGFAEMDLTELQEQATHIVEAGGSPHNAIMAIHKRFSLPAACLAFALIALTLGVTSRKDGKLASFALGIGVIFTYYVLMYGSEAMAKGALVSPHLAMWVPNIVIAGVGCALLIRRSVSAEGGVWPKLPVRWPRVGRLTRPAPTDEMPRPVKPAPPASRRGPAPRATGWSIVGLLDRYIAMQYLRLVGLSFVGLLGIFYISTFVDLSDKVFKGQATFLMIGEYFWYQTPQWVYFVLPISTLVATLITIGVLTRSSELTVMKACGISLYRTSLPLVLFSLVWSAALFGMSETFLAEANRRADERNDAIRGITRPVFDALNRKWIMSPDGAIYHYGSFDQTGEALHDLTVYRFEPDAWQVSERAFATRAVYDASGWQGHDAWVRRFEATTDEDAFVTSDVRPFAIEPPDYFAAESPDALRMNYQELNTYIGELAASGVDVVPLQVSLARKLSFPLVTLILTLIAVPFAVTTGRHGTLYGVGIGIMLAIAYWVVISVFSAFGSAGLLTPALAAWAPNVLFGGVAVYLLLTVRT